MEGCPQSIAVILGTGPTRSISWQEPTGMDFQGTPIVPTKTHSPDSSFAIGHTEVVYTFTDNGGRSSTCAFAVTVAGKNFVLI